MIWRLLFWILFIVGVGLRTFLVFNLDTQPISDFIRFYEAAISLSEGNGFVMFDRLTAFQGVGYPAFLALFFYWFGPSVMLAKLLNLILSVVSAFLFYWIVKRFTSEKTAMLATLVYVFLPKEILYVNVLATEILYNTLLLAYLASYFASWPKQVRTPGNWIWLIVAGLILGYMSLVKPLSPLFGLVVFFGELLRHGWLKVFYKRGGWGQALIRTSIVAIVSILVIAPWTYRNYVVFGSFVPNTTNGGYVLYVNNNDYATGAWMDPYKIPGSPIYQITYPETDPRFEVEMDRLMKEEAKQWISENPGRFLALSIYRFNETFYTNLDWRWAFEVKEEDRGEMELTKAFLMRAIPSIHALVNSVFFIAYPALLLGFGAAAWKGRRTRKGVDQEGWDQRLALVLFCLPALLFTIVTMIFEGNARYSFLCHPMFALLTAWVASSVKEKISTQ
ncbi:glycosyltransferase family 39 protein [Ammoniphilus sp. YIM 78166]|uniref:ArnT family glycosyltransferase n=1 Tax=Ammoniphilus sp. YIM 78166 TaxID=1644106 RepID=UPI00106FE6BE|nr:glycosyltransferase family 39 protein [Ammoniphilus sp. YIM 78166]